MINTNHWTWMPSRNRVKQCSVLQLFNLLLGCIYSLASINETGHYNVAVESSILDDKTGCRRHLKIHLK